MTLTEEDKAKALNWLDGQVSKILAELGTDNIDEAIKRLS